MAISISDLIGYAFKSMLHSKMRTTLTLIAIIIGISMLIVLFGLSGGMKLSVSKKLSTFGPHSIAVSPINIKTATMMARMMPTMGKLFESDYNRIKMVSGIDIIMKVISGRTNVIYQNSKNIYYTVGVEPGKMQKILTNLEIDKGRFLNNQDVYSALLGHDIAESGFDKSIQVGSIINIENKSFRVVGILKEVGNDMLQTDNSIFVPEKTAKDLLSYELLPNEISSIRIKVNKNYDVESVADNINQVLLLSHHVTESDKDFSIITPKSINQKIDSVLGIITTFVGLISIIALVIGAVGTANTIYMGVIERTREIGTLRAVGMRSKDIVMLFLFEAGLLGIIGGIVGIILGYLILYIFNWAGVLVSFNLQIGLIGFFVSIVVAAIAGYFPSRKAGKLSPTVALRYE